MAQGGCREVGGDVRQGGSGRTGDAAESATTINNCGAIVEGEKAPEVCPVCDHPQAYFQLEQNNF